MNADDVAAISAAIAEATDDSLVVIMPKSLSQNIFIIDDVTTVDEARTVFRALADAPASEE